MRGHTVGTRKRIEHRAPGRQVDVFQRPEVQRSPAFVIVSLPGALHAGAVGGIKLGRHQCVGGQRGGFDRASEDGCGLARLQGGSRSRNRRHEADAVQKRTHDRHMDLHKHSAGIYIARSNPGSTFRAPQASRDSLRRSAARGRMGAARDAGIRAGSVAEGGRDHRPACRHAGGTKRQKADTGPAFYDKGEDRIRTDGWRLCRPLPYHLATSPQGGPSVYPKSQTCVKHRLVTKIRGPEAWPPRLQNLPRKQRVHPGHRRRCGTWAPVGSRQRPVAHTLPGQTGLLGRPARTRNGI